MGSIIADPLVTAREIVDWLRKDLLRDRPMAERLGQLQAKIQVSHQAREDDRQHAYRERNALVAFLSRCYPSHLALHPESDQAWDRTWRHIVCVHPRGQIICPPQEHQTLAWHVHDSDVPLFSHLEMREDDWDGSDTPTKYERLRRLP